MREGEPLSVYLPGLLLRELARGPDAAPEELPAAVLFADLSGFTQLAEQLAAEGSTGLERLTERLNVELGWIVECVRHYGGDVVRFAGDAIFALWPAAAADLQSAVLRACRCGLDVHTRRGGLGVRVGISAGPVLPLIFGGGRPRREFFVAGAPLRQMGRAERLAAAGEVLLAADAWAQVAGLADGEARAEGAVRLLHLRVPVVSEGPPAPAGSVPEDTLRAFIPRTLLNLVDAGHRGWGAELRPLTVMFVNLPELGVGGPAEAARLTALIEVMQREIYAVSGSINKLLVEDKGLVLLAGFGLPPHVHENDAARALHAARRIRDRLRAEGVGHGVGIATGRAFCGIYGCAERREYSILGDVVNLAARLMQAAEDDVLCDAATARALGDGGAGLAGPFAVQVRGKATPVTVYRPLIGDTPTPLRGRARGELLGRERERDALAERLDRLAADEGGLVVIRGDPGLGKSALLDDASALASSRGLAVLVGAGGDIEQAAAYHAWKSVMADLCARDRAHTAEERWAWLASGLASHPRGAEWAPLLASLLDLPADDRTAAARLTAAARAEAVRELVLHLLRRAGAPLLVLFDDVQWLDPASWSLCAALRHGIPGALLVLAGRLDAAAPPPPLAELLETSDALLLTLEPLTDEAIEEVVAERLNASRLDAALADLLRGRAEGNPLFAVELALALRSVGSVVIEGDVARLNPRGVADDELPDTIQGVVLSRLNQQTQQQQLTLKIASVVGRHFGARIVRDVHPLEVDRPHVEEHLGALTRASLITPFAAPEPTYAFRHSVIQEVAYSLLAHAQRRQLHRALAEWQERCGTTTPERYAVLAYHWSRAQERERARDYAERAGLHASAGGVFHEAAYFFEQAIGLEDPSTSAPELLRRARWRRSLGEARSEIGAHNAALSVLLEGIALLGRRLPEGRLGWILLGLAQAVRFALKPARGRERADPRRERDAELARLTALVTYEFFFAVRLLEMVVMSLLSVNLAERSGSYSPSALAYNNLGYLLGLLGADRASARTFARARMGDVRAQCRSHLSEGLLALGRADFAAAERHFERSLSVAQEAGDRFGAASAISSFGTVHELRGDFAAALAQADALMTVARGCGNRRFEFWGVIARGTACTLLGRHDEAVAWVARRDDLAEEDVLTSIGVHGIRAHVHLRAGDLDEALRHAALCEPQLRRTGAGVFTHIKALTGISEVYLAAWEDHLARGSDVPRDIKASARRAVRDFAAYARTFPIGQSRAARVRGDLHWLEGRRQRARAAWRRALAAAESAGLDYDAALARLHHARRADPAAPERSADLDAARATFARLGAAHELALTDAVADAARPTTEPERDDRARAAG
jgi:class 3 adenylate cyclase/tetratricopeptide (TPR) repeat protein